jgi:hypothetical protein
MAKPKDKGPTFTIYARKVSILSAEVTGVKTMEEALVKAKTLKSDDFGIEDYSLEVTGVNKENNWNTD